MIFDFERCIYEPKDWHFEAYYHNENVCSEEVFLDMWKKNHSDLPTDEEVKKATCSNYGILTMFFDTEWVEIKFYDDDIKKMIIAIRSAHKRGDGYVFYNGEFEDEHFNKET